MMRTKKEFLKFFRTEILPEIRAEYETDRRIDYPARRETWNNLVDAMASDRQIPRSADWVCPW